LSATWAASRTWATCRPPVRHRHQQGSECDQGSPRLGIPVVAIVDTNCDPDTVDFAIPGNDDASRALELYVLADLEGRYRRHRPFVVGLVPISALPAAAPVEELASAKMHQPSTKSVRVLRVLI
jgi:hypothetical protein